MDLVFKTDKSPRVTSSKYAAELKQSLEKAYDKVRQTTGAKQLLQNRLYDRRVHGEPYQVGDHVYHHCPYSGQYQETASPVVRAIPGDQEAQ